MSTSKKYRELKTLRDSASSALSAIKPTLDQWEHIRSYVGLVQEVYQMMHILVPGAGVSTVQDSTTSH